MANRANVLTGLKITEAASTGKLLAFLDVNKVSGDYTSHFSYSMVVGSGQSGVTLPIGTITNVKFVALSSDEIVTFHLTEGTPQDLTCSSLILTDSDITALTVDGNITANATIKVLLSGD